MNIEDLKNIDDINFEMLPPIMAEEYNKLKFQFDIEFDGMYFPREVFNAFYAEVIPEAENDKLHKINFFNSTITNSIQDYKEGYWDSFYKENLFAGITTEDAQIFEIFSRIYKKLPTILNPGISTFKKNIQIYNDSDFIKEHLYDYGFEVGTFIKAWTIILNNILLFEPIFTKYFDVPKVNKNDTVPFKVAMLFAKREVYKKLVFDEGFRYFHLNKEFTSINKLALHLNLSRQYLNDTFQENRSPHNIYLNFNLMQSVVNYCDNNAIDVDDFFLEKFNKLKEKQSY